jgi:hypothetical protein
VGTEKKWPAPREATAAVSSGGRATERAAVRVCRAADSLKLSCGGRLGGFRFWTCAKRDGVASGKPQMGQCVYCLSQNPAATQADAQLWRTPRTARCERRGVWRQGKPSIHHYCYSMGPGPHSPGAPSEIRAWCGCWYQLSWSVAAQASVGMAWHQQCAKGARDPSASWRTPLKSLRRNRKPVRQGCQEFGAVVRARVVP